MMDDLERKEWTRRVLACLNHEKCRCTYGALARILGLANQGVGRHLGDPRPETSWVVLKATGQPGGDWAPDRLAEGLCDGPEPISCHEELKRLVTEHESDLMAHDADTMNDPHVMHLEYCIVCDPKRIDWSAAEAVVFEDDDFTVEVKDQRVLFRFKTHYSSEEEAKSSVEPYRRNWEFTAGLAYGPDAFTLRFSRSEIIDRDPTPGNTKTPKFFFSLVGDLTLNLDIIFVPARYSGPPASGTMKRTPDIDSMYHRYLGYRAGREPFQQWRISVWTC
ncbi:MAG: hypothetical protein OXC91_13585 [Rhodobacteraceae bacterium]|nr:hypothetical protein [Paracoccaceae bacterium]